MAAFWRDRGVSHVSMSVLICPTGVKIEANISELIKVGR